MALKGLRWGLGGICRHKWATVGKNGSGTKESSCGARSEKDEKYSALRIRQTPMTAHKLLHMDVHIMCGTEGNHITFVQELVPYCSTT